MELLLPSAVSPLVMVIIFHCALQGYGRRTHGRPTLCPGHSGPGRPAMFTRARHISKPAERSQARTESSPLLSDLHPPAGVSSPRLLH